MHNILLLAVVRSLLMRLLGTWSVLECECVQKNRLMKRNQKLVVAVAAVVVAVVCCLILQLGKRICTSVVS